MKRTLDGMILGLCALGAISTAADVRAQTPKEKKAKRTIKLDPAKVAEGKTLYGQCSGCHGALGEGRVGIAPQLTSASFLEAASDEMLIETIQKGRAGTTMVPWGGILQPAQVKSIVAYLRSLQPTKPALLDESPLKGDAERGADVFRSICSTCHGRSGAGYMESGSGTGIGRQAFLETVSDGYLRHIIKEGKTGTAMKAFSKRTVMAVANLTDKEIEDVIAHLRSSAW